MIPDHIRIVATKHFLERIVQRFDSFLPSYGNDRELRKVIDSLIRSGRHLEDWKQVPFYYNAICIKNGLGTEFFQICEGRCMVIAQRKEEEGVLLLVTAVPKMLYYSQPGSMAIATKGGSRFVNEAKFLASLEVEAYDAYKDRFGNTPAGVWASSDKYLNLERLKQKESAKFRRLEKIEAQLPKISSMNTAEQFHINRIAVLKELGLHTKQDDVKMFSHLIELANYQIERVGNQNAHKNLIRYTESLKGLTDAN
jgi:hypothetical protein